MVSKTDPIEPDAVNIPQIPPERMGDPNAYVELTAHVMQGMMANQIKPLDADRMMKVIAERCAAVTGMELADVAREQQDPVKRFKGLMESGAAELEKVRASMLKVDQLREEEKKRYSRLIDQAIETQRQARDDPAKGMIYVLRDADAARAGEVLDLQWFHLRFFDVWNDTSKLNNLIMAPPGSGKTTCKRWQICHEIGHMPELRCLLVYDTKEKAGQESLTIKLILRSERYLSLFPDIRVLGRTEGEADSSMRFTVGRKNWMAREPTIEAVGIDCNINGQGYDRIHGDDYIPPKAAFYQHVRNQTSKTWDRVVEARLRDPANGRISVICTPWHEDDKNGRIRKDAAAGRLPTWRVEIEPFAIKDDADGNPKPLWPKAHVVDVLKQKRFADPHGYSCCYKLEARNARRRAVNRIHWYNAEGRNPQDNDLAILAGLRDPKKTERWLSIDPSATAAPHSSDQGVIEFCISPKRYGFITDVWLDLKQDPSSFRQWIADRCMEAFREGRPYTGIAIEAQGGMSSMASMFYTDLPRMLTEAGMPSSRLPVILRPGSNVGTLSLNRSKLQRLADAAPWIDWGIVRFAGTRQYISVREHAPGPPRSPYQLTYCRGTQMERLAEYLREFDGSNRSDAVDAVSQIILLMRDRLANPAAPQAKPTAKAGPTDPVTAAFANFCRELEDAQDPDNDSAFHDEVNFLVEAYGGAAA